MKKYAALLIAALSLSKAATAGTVGGGGGPPPKTMMIAREDFLNVHKELFKDQMGVEISVRGQPILVEKFDFLRQQMNGKDLSTGEALALRPVALPKAFIKENALEEDIPSVEIINQASSEGG